MPHSVEFDEKTFAAVFPFGFIASSEGILQWVGDSLGRHVEGRIGAPLSTFVRVLKPLRCEPDASMVRGPGRTIRLRCEGLATDLRGHAFWLPGEERFAFAGTPVVRTIEELGEAGLKLGDFDPSDATPDLLMSMQTARTALDDARRLGEELRVALHQAQAGMAVKSRFLAVMSHEIRTPLNGFGSMLDLLLEDHNRPDADELLHTMDDCARGLMTLLNDILDFSKLEDGSVRLEALPFAVSSVLRAATAPFVSQAESAGVELRVEITPRVPRAAIGDPYRLRQILSNLTGNAVKFTESGRVVVSVDRVADDLVMTVEDTGRGIPAAARDTLFEPFSQADASTTREFGGTGLGLTISRQLARAMGGDLELTHTGPVGSTFTLRVPCLEAEPVADEEQASGAPEARERASFEGVDVLVADDNPTNRLVVDRLLKRLGATAHLAEDGQEALDLLGTRSFDVVLMDLMMPRMDGCEATRRFRASDAPWNDLPIIAFTAAAFAEDREVALEAGMDDFLEKPVRLDALEATLARHCSHRDAPRA